MQLSNREKFLVYAELAKLVAAGFGIGKAATLLAGQTGSAAMRRFAQDLEAGLAKGVSVAEAVSDSRTRPSALEASVLQATGSGGVLAEGLRYLRDHFESQWKLWRKVRGGLVYPAFLLHLAAFVPVIPPAVTGQPVGDGLWRALFTLGGVYLGGGGLVLGGRLLNRSAQTHKLSDRILLALPVAGRARKEIALQRFSGILRVYLRCGSTMSVAMNGAGAATQSAVFAGVASRIARSAERGDAIGGHLESSRIFPADFARSLANAERVGGLEEDLDRWTEWYRQSVAARMEQIGVWLPKACYLLVALYVGWQVIRTYVGIYEPVLRELERVM